MVIEFIYKFRLNIQGPVRVKRKVHSKSGSRQSGADVSTKIAQYQDEKMGVSHGLIRVSWYCAAVSLIRLKGAPAKQLNDPNTRDPTAKRKSAKVLNYHHYSREY